MTLTQSQIYYEALKKLSPEIIIIDESAENHESDVAHLLAFQPKHFIQLGDHYQLQPIVNNQYLSLVFHYGFSQFQRLLEIQLPYEVLVYQRRMTAELSKFVRFFYTKDTYKDTKECKNAAIEGIETQTDVIFIPHTYEEVQHRDYPYTVNFFEAIACIKIAERLIIEKNIKHNQITILCMYKGQEYLIKETLHYIQFDKDFEQDIKKVQICTVDSYQGKENDVIILSCVRSNVGGSIGFLRQMNRVNVAFSRARKVAYYIGNFVFLSEKNYNSQWNNIFNLAKSGFHITKNLPSYQRNINWQFQRSNSRLKQSNQTECMFCYDPTQQIKSHMGLCISTQFKRNQFIQKSFPSQEERQKYYEYQQILSTNKKHSEDFREE